MPNRTISLKLNPDTLEALIDKIDVYDRTLKRRIIK